MGENDGTHEKQTNWPHGNTSQLPAQSVRVGAMLHSACPATKPLRPAPKLPMLCLQSRTEEAWLARAIAHTNEILIDHAHCERKAATQALQLLGRFPDRPELVGPLVDLAREELEHFQIVLALLSKRGVRMDSLPPADYQKQLHLHVRKQMPDKLVDLLLVAALIEARSCERFKLLAERHPDVELRTAFRGLLEAEARHHALFVRLAEGVAPRDEVRARLAVLAEAERQVIEAQAPLARLHA